MDLKPWLGFKSELFLTAECAETAEMSEKEKLDGMIEQIIWIVFRVHEAFKIQGQGSERRN